MMAKLFGCGLFCFMVLPCNVAPAQDARSPQAEVRLRLAFSGQTKLRAVPAVAWLEPVEGTPPLPFVAHGRYTLLQKDRMFSPHLLVIPVGSVVSFPNADPFYHNVFSLFDGKRFDLGLYEAGSSKQVPFTREGVSYIFCNIHPQMSAVVLAISTPLYAIADSANAFALRQVPPGDYKLHVWAEGVPQPALDRLGRRIHLSSGAVDLGELNVSANLDAKAAHTDKFGQPYEPEPAPAY